MFLQRFEFTEIITGRIIIILPTIFPSLDERAFINCRLRFPNIDSGNSTFVPFSVYKYKYYQGKLNREEIAPDLSEIRWIYVNEFHQNGVRLAATDTNPCAHIVLLNLAECKISID